MKSKQLEQRVNGLWAILWASNMPKNPKYFVGRGYAPDPIGGAHGAPPDLLLSGGRKGGQGAMPPPKPWIKKL